MASLLADYDKRWLRLDVAVGLVTGIVVIPKAMAYAAVAEGRVFFANAQRIGDKMRPFIEEAKPRVVALHMRGVPDIEYTALKMLTEAEKRQRERGVELWLVGMNPEVLAVVQRSPLGRVLGRERMHFNLEMAVAHYLATERAGIPPTAAVTSRA